jgi:hypothetical protein
MLLVAAGAALATEFEVKVKVAVGLEYDMVVVCSSEFAEGIRWQPRSSSQVRVGVYGCKLAVGEVVVEL